VHLDSISFDAPTDRIEHNGAVRDRHLPREFPGREIGEQQHGFWQSTRVSEMAWLRNRQRRPPTLDFVIFTIADRQHKNRYIFVYIRLMRRQVSIPPIPGILISSSPAS